ncbi:hypothetical protein H0H93_000273, partial [Arthromyces matolae]
YSIQGDSFAETQFVSPSPPNSIVPPRTNTPDFDQSLFDIDPEEVLPTQSPITESQSPTNPLPKELPKNMAAEPNTRLPARGKAAAPQFHPNQP